MEIVDLLPVRPQSGFFMFDHRGIDQKPKTVLIRVFDQVMHPQCYLATMSHGVTVAYRNQVCFTPIETAALDRNRGSGLKHGRLEPLFQSRAT